MASNQAEFSARKVLDLLLPVGRTYFWNEQPVFGENIAKEIVGCLSASTLDRMNLLSSDGYSVPAVRHDRSEKLRFVERSLAGQLDSAAAAAIKLMSRLIDQLTESVAIDKPFRQSDIEDFSAQINQALVLAFRECLRPIEMDGFLRIDCGSPDLIYRLGLTEDLRSHIQACIKAHIGNARIGLANALRACLNSAVKVEAEAATLSVR
jgi:hypothetical protein